MRVRPIPERMHTTMETGAMPCAKRSCWYEGMLRARMLYFSLMYNTSDILYRCGCMRTSVHNWMQRLLRPPSISGALVISDTSLFIHQPLDPLNTIYNSLDWYPSIPDFLYRPPRSNQPHARSLAKTFGELQESRLVVDRQHRCSERQLQSSCSLLGAYTHRSMLEMTFCTTRSW